MDFGIFFSLTFSGDAHYLIIEVLGLTDEIFSKFLDAVEAFHVQFQGRQLFFSWNWCIRKHCDKTLISVWVKMLYLFLIKIKEFTFYEIFENNIYTIFLSLNFYKN